MIIDQKKEEIVKAIQQEKERLGSMNKVATKLGISAAHISANILKPENWANISDIKWADLAASLGVSLVNRNWNLVPTRNMAMMHRVFADAQNEGMFMAISEKAGSGKTASIAAYCEKDKLHSVYVLQCEEWSRKYFLVRLAKELGLTVGKYDTSLAVTEEIVRFFKQRSKEVAPLLILDEADKLKPAALRFLILLFNRLEDEIGLVVCGTDNLEKEIKAGVRKQLKGYDEIDSRLGRRFIHLVGFDLNDVRAICNANGITEDNTINRIFESGSPDRMKIDSKNTEMIYDMRAIKRAIKRARLAMSYAA